MSTDRFTLQIKREAAKRKFTTPNPEITCLIMEFFSYNEIKNLGLSMLVNFHKPIKSHDNNLHLLSTDGDTIYANYGNDNNTWGDDVGFVFEISRKSV